MRVNLLVHTAHGVEYPFLVFDTSRPPSSCFTSTAKVARLLLSLSEPKAPEPGDHCSESVLFAALLLWVTVVLRRMDAPRARTDLIARAV